MVTCAALLIAVGNVGIKGPQLQQSKLVLQFKAFILSTVVYTHPLITVCRRKGRII